MSNLQTILTKRNRFITLAIIVVIFGICIWFLFGEREAENSWKTDAVQSQKEETVTTEVKPRAKIMVDVKGAVKQPGAYVFQDGDRVADLIEQAGGFLEKADRNKVNLAALLKDEMVIYVPKIGEKVAMNALEMPENNQLSSAVSNQVSEQAGKVNLNTASAEQLQTVKGIGPSKAEAILAKRNELGGFKTVEDLKQVKGIGDKTFEKLKELVCVN